MDEKRTVLVIDKKDEEMLELLSTLDYNIKETIHFKNKSSRYHIGRGKVEQLKRIEQKDYIVINAELKPSQCVNLEDEIRVPIFDRIHIILKIFEEHAKSNEAKLQVEHAQLQFEISLIKERIHRAKISEHAGFMGGGEYEIYSHYTLTKKRIKNIEKKLKKIKDDRELQRKSRSEKGFFLVSIVGYTNSGKSTLLKSLTNCIPNIDDKMFSTISPKTSKLTSTKRKILLTDTVGFIENLPEYLMNSFRSTLEEILFSDLILLVIDISEPIEKIKKKLKVCYDMILEKGEESDVVVVCNKSDLLDKEQTLKKLNSLNIENNIIISAKEGMGIGNLKFQIENRITMDKLYHITVPINSNYKSLISLIYDYGILDFCGIDEGVELKFRINSKYTKEIEESIDSLTL